MAGRTLKSAVLHEAVYYDAGTDESEIRNADAIKADVWEGESHSSTPDVVDQAEFEKAAQALTEANATIEELRARVVELEGQVASAAESKGDGGDDVKGAYDGLDVDALKAEIDKRNDGREQDQRIDKRGGVEKLVAALVADDEAQEG